MDRTQSRLERLWRSVTTIDAIAVSSIVAAGICAFLLCSRERGFLFDDVFYADAGRSLIDNGFYGIQGRPEVNQPPGLPALLGLLCEAVSCSHLAFVRAMVVCATAGLLAAHALLRRLAPPSVGAGICILLAIAMPWVELETRYLYPCFPFLLTSFLALFALHRAETVNRRSTRVAWSVASCVFVSASILTASAGIALLGAMAARVALAFLRAPPLARARLRVYAPVLIAGVAVQVFWMRRAPAPPEWPELPGYPASYLEQVKVRSGNEPQLGLAVATDIPVRIAKNLFGRAKMLSQLIAGRWLRDLWSSSIIFVVLALVVIGWGRSILATGGDLADWYFAGHEAIYLLWSWRTELRFFIAVAPLACLYFWRGLEFIRDAAEQHPRALGLALLPCAIAGLSLSTATSLRGADGSLWHGGLSAVIWIACACAAAATAWNGRSPLLAAGRWWRQAVPGHVPAGGRLWPKALVAAGLFSWLLYADIVTFRENLHPFPAPPPIIEALLWVRSHTEPGAVVMARHVPIAHAISQRRVVWFPPLSDANTLMRGIRRLGVSWIVLEGDEYYLPPDFDCFAALLAAFPGSFELAFHDARTRIYRVRRPL